MSRIILASASPRRKELLEQIGLDFEICPAKGEEVITSEIPQEAVMELARRKAREVAAGLLAFNEKHGDLTSPQDMLVIGADTVVSLEGRIMGKPKDEEDAARMLSALSGKTHSVYTGVSFVIISASGRTGEHCFYEKTDVSMCPITQDEIRRYIATGEPMDKAGAYGIQGACAIHISGICGDYNNVVGLPLAGIYRELRNIGIDVYRDF